MFDVLYMDVFCMRHCVRARILDVGRRMMRATWDVRVFD